MFKYIYLSINLCDVKDIVVVVMSFSTYKHSSSETNEEHFWNPLLENPFSNKEGDVEINVLLQKTRKDNSAHTDRA